MIGGGSLAASLVTTSEAELANVAFGYEVLHIPAGQSGQLSATRVAQSVAGTAISKRSRIGWLSVAPSV